jgi:ATP-binding cassette subfamily A (ABC1) protein 3
MQFRILFKKNFIYWKRNYKASVAEILVPLLLSIVMIFLRRSTSEVVIAEGSSVPIPLLTSISDVFTYRIPLLRRTMKDCSGRNGGSVGLAPSFEITQSLQTYFKILNYTTIFFNNNEEIDQWTQSGDYLGVLPDGSRKQLCFAVVFDKTDRLNYEYSFRYNITGNPATVDHVSTDSKKFKNEFKVEDLEAFQKLTSNGIMTLQGLIDSLIFIKDLNVKSSIKMQKMYNPQYTFADYSLALESPFIIILIASGLISFLRFISQIVSERESRNIENMESMGLSKFQYMLSIYCFNLSVQLLIAILFTIIIKIGVIKQANVLVIFITYFMFVFSFMVIGSVITAFFVVTKKAIITGLIVFFILFMFWILRDSLAPTSYIGTTLLALSPIGAVAQFTKNLIVFESSNKPFQFTDLAEEINSFKGQTYFIVMIVEILIFFWLGIYLFYVVPLSIGVSKHPLFLFGFPRKTKASNQESKGSLKEDEENVKLKTSFISKNFEDVAEELKQQSSSNQTISVQNLSKIFSNKKLAVDKISLEMYKDQIFALLGHNGAGKSTTIAMISGFLEKTTGTINIMGMDADKSREQIKQIMGICPQYNSIFSYLTVKEHLELYARLKGIKGNFESEIDEILSDLDLLHKKNYLAGKLSGGQKRKLCVAIALMGQSRIILLDEPTSGMDTFARRHLWEILKKYKKDRIIILSTHNMDEADYLGDRIGIMANGCLVTCGSSLFLKKRFGDGYELVVLKRQDASEEKSQKIKNLVSNLVKDSVFLSEIGSELKFRLPSSSKQFHQLFRQLETQSETFGVQSFGITLATLEDVFIKVANLSEAEKSIGLTMPETINNSEISKIHIEPEDPVRKFENIESEIQDKDLKSLQVSEKSKIFGMQLKALVKKRLIFFSRDVSGIICELFLPLMIILAGLALTKISFITIFPKLSISNELYTGANKFIMNDLLSPFGENLTSEILTRFNEENLSPLIANATNVTTFDTFVYEQRSSDLLFAYFLNEVSPAKLDYTFFINTTAVLAPYLGVNSLNNALFKYLSKDNSASIKMNLNPLMPTPGAKSLEDTIDGFIITMLISLAFSFIPSSMILFIIKERENNAKHQQIISGMNISAYWLSNFFVDFTKYLVPSMSTFVLFFVFDVSFFTKDERAGMSFLLLFLYGFAMIAYTYFSSFLFRTPSSGQIFIFLFCFFSSFVLIIVAFSLKLISDTRDLEQDYLDYVFRLIPSFSFPYGFLMMANKSLFTILFSWPKDLSVFSSLISLNDVIYLPCISIITFILIFTAEYWYMIADRFFKKPIPEALLKEIEGKDIDSESQIDSDVQEETMSVLNNLCSFVVKIVSLWKIYPVQSSADKEGLDIKYKAAIKGISFGVQKGMVFSLLGTNGAGKTSTFKILTGDVSASSGDATIMDYAMPKNLNEIRNLVGYCPQFDSILDNLTALEHLNLYANLKGIQPAYQEALIERILQTMNLLKYRNVQAGTYSGGNKRKLSVAIALLGRPPIVFLDEPSSGMDPEARRFMWNVISDISTKHQHSSVILTTHSMEEAEALSTKIAIMVEGRIKTIGSVQRLKEKFGKGFELDIKISLPSEEERNHEIEKMFDRASVHSNKKVTKEELKVIFENEELREFEKEIALGKKGSAIYKRLEVNKYVEGDLLIEWLIISKKLRQVEISIKNRFSAETLEVFQSYTRFKVPDGSKLSEIFEFMDSIKDDLAIATYSVRQISLEQIFIQFAQEIRHDD